MALRQIRQYGDYILQKKAREVIAFDGTLHQLLGDMWDTLREYDGLGLAAPQIGILKRIIVLEMEDDDPYELINPVIVEENGKETNNEACLSVPNKQGDVERPTYIKLEYQDRDGTPFTLEADDLLATALCHELDHLDGILFIDRAIRIQDRPPETDAQRKERRKQQKRALKKHKKLRKYRR